MTDSGAVARVLTRRRVLAGSMAAVVALAARPATARQDGTPAASGSGEWAWVDDAGETITLPAMPERVVAYMPVAASLWDFGMRPVGVYGPTRRPDGTPEVYVGNVDLDAVVSLGEEYGELDLEALVALQPDLLVNDMWADPPDIFGLDADTVAQIEAVAPIGQIKFVDRPITDTIRGVEALAAALGADTASPEVVAAREEFEKASDELRAAIAEKPGLKVMFASGTPDSSFWVANPSVNADLLYFKELGLEIAQPDIEEGYFEEVSWEQAGKYPADLILIDARQWSSTGEDLKARVPTFAALPAAKADQFGPWLTEYVPSYAGFTPVLQALAGSIRGAEVVG